MVKYRKYKMLHDMAHHTNMTVPYSKYVAADKFPEQDASKLNTEVYLRYRDSNRQLYDPFDPADPDEQILICKDKFIIVRYDLTEPYRFIAIGYNTNVIIVSTTDKYEEEVTRYPIQYNQFLGLYCTQYYVDNPESEIKAIALRVDAGEPSYSVLVEFFNNNIIRFVLGDEVQSIVNEKYDEEQNYDAMDPADHMLTYININGRSPEDEGSPISIDANGYYPDPLLYIYKFEPLSKDEMNDLREEIFTGRTIYGSDS